MIATSQVQPPRASRLESIQILRALAATMVVALHASILLFPAGGIPLIHKFGVGVDLFFVISGFVIVYSARSLFETRGGWRRFLLLRLIRVVPLYWMALSLRLVLLAGAALAGVKAFPDAIDILTSYFFIPHDSMGYGDAYPFPILDLGWSLNFEMFFYFVFAFFLILPMRRAVLSCGAVMVLGVALAFFVPLPLPFGFWLQPIILEFVAGMALALIYTSGFRIPPLVSLALVVAALYVWFGGAFDRFASSDGPGYYALPRFIFMGGGAICLMAAATLTRDLELPRPLLALSTLGDSSYALYLLHPFILTGFKPLLRLLPPDPLILAPALLLVVLATVGCAHAFHVVVERRMNEKLRALTAVRQPSAVMKHS